MSAAPLASIVVTTYNQEQSLPVTLDSLLAQKTSFPFEIVVGEDCSKDGTRAVLADYAQRYPEVIRPAYNEHNLGILGNYVSTLRQCRGKYIAGCAGDDFWNDPEKLQSLAENAGKLAYHDSANVIAQEVWKLANE